MPCIAALLAYGLSWLALPLLWTHRKLHAGHAARLGWYRHGMPPKRQPRIWVHGASAGDVLALLPTVRALRARRPDLEVVATTITDSGFAMLKRHLPLFCGITYAPLDLPGAVRRALRALQPDVLILEYTELWPNLIYAARAQQVRLVLHNGRFSGARLGRYACLFKLVGNLLRPFSLLLMRDGHELQRALQLGAPALALHVTGNTKFDNVAQAPAAAKVAELRAACGFAPDSTIWVAGSTHEGEEDLLLDVFVDLRQSFADLRLVLAPRYTERGDKLLALCARRRLRARRRTQPSPPSSADPDVLVLDTIGELSACYELASLVFVGGSFVPRGGQNILEPAACGKPVLFGPNMQNFADSVQVLLGRGGIQVASQAQLGRVMADLLRRPATRLELGLTAQAQVRAIDGAARRNAELIGQLLPAATA